MGAAKGVASRIDDAPVPKIVTFQKSFTTENEEKTISFFCKDPLQEFARTTENPRKKRSLCTILSLEFQEILTVIIGRPVERYREFLKHQLCKKVRKIMCHMCFRMDWASKFETSLSSRVYLKEDLR